MVPVYVINLDRSAERLARISAALQAVGIAFERIPAIDASNLKPADSENAYDAEANRRNYLAPLSPQEIACFLSHRRAWQTFLKSSEAPFAVFLEDDAAPLFDQVNVQDLRQTFADPERAQIIKLYLPPSALIPFQRPLVPPLGAVAQAMNRAAVQTLLEFTERFHEPVDVALQRWWDHGVRVTVARPLWFAEAAGDSTIRSRRQEPPEGRWLREIRRPLFQLRRTLWAARALVKGRCWLRPG
jgi:glycosyl transferase family 25